MSFKLFTKKNINILLTHFDYNIQLTPELIDLLTAGLELIKVIES